MEIYLKELDGEPPRLVRMLMKSIHKEDKRRVRHIGSLPSCHLVPYGLGLRGQQPG